MQIRRIVLQSPGEIKGEDSFAKRRHSVFQKWNYSHLFLILSLSPSTVPSSVPVFKSLTFGRENCILRSLTKNSHHSVQDTRQAFPPLTTDVPRLLQYPVQMTWRCHGEHCGRKRDNGRVKDHIIGEYHLHLLTGLFSSFFLPLPNPSPFYPKHRKKEKTLSFQFLSL